MKAEYVLEMVQRFAGISDDDVTSSVIRNPERYIDLNNDCLKSLAMLLHACNQEINEKADRSAGKYSIPAIKRLMKEKMDVVPSLKDKYKQYKRGGQSINITWGLEPHEFRGIVYQVLIVGSCMIALNGDVKSVDHNTESTQTSGGFNRLMQTTTFSGNYSPQFLALPDISKLSSMKQEQKRNPIYVRFSKVVPIVKLGNSFYNIDLLLDCISAIGGCTVAQIPSEHKDSPVLELTNENRDFAMVCPINLSNARMNEYEKRYGSEDRN